MGRPGPEGHGRRALDGAGHIIPAAWSPVDLERSHIRRVQYRPDVS